MIVSEPTIPSLHEKMAKIRRWGRRDPRRPLRVKVAKNRNRVLIELPRRLQDW